MEFTKRIKNGIDAYKFLSIEKNCAARGALYLIHHGVLEFSDTLPRDWTIEKATPSGFDKIDLLKIYEAIASVFKSCTVEEDRHSVIEKVKLMLLNCSDSEKEFCSDLLDCCIFDRKVYREVISGEIAENHSCEGWNANDYLGLW